MITVAFAIFFISIFIGLPLYAGLIFSGLIFIFHFDLSFTIIIQRMFSIAQSFPLLAIPFFILAGELMNTGGVSRRLIDFAQSLVGHIWGGLAQVVVLVSMFFAGMSGSAIADASGVGTILIPAMKKKGYSSKFSAAVVASAGTIGIMIPPSIPMVIYGWIVSESVAKLFLAGAVPGVLVGASLMVLCMWSSYKRGYAKEKRASFNEIVSLSKKVFLALLTPLIVVGGVIFGFVTATESAVVAVVWSFFLGMFVYKDLKWKMLPEILTKTTVSTAKVMIIIATANTFAWLLAFANVPQQISAFIFSITDNKYLLLLLINILLLVTGMFMDLTPALLILTPILYPVVSQIGVDPVHFGVIMVVNLAIGLFTPPVGTTLFVASSLAKLPIEEVAKELIPFYMISLIVLILITYIPAISLWLPSLF